MRYKVKSDDPVEPTVELALHQRGAEVWLCAETANGEENTILKVTEDGALYLFPWVQDAFGMCRDNRGCIKIVDKDY